MNFTTTIKEQKAILKKELEKETFTSLQGYAVNIGISELETQDTLINELVKHGLGRY